MSVAELRQAVEPDLGGIARSRRLLAELDDLTERLRDGTHDLGRQLAYVEDIVFPGRGGRR